MRRETSKIIRFGKDCLVGRLVDETESHVVIGFLLLLFLLFLLLLLGGGRGSGTSTTGGGSASATTSGHGRELLAALSDELVDVLAAQLGNDLLQLLLVGVDSDGGDDGLDVGSLGAGVAAEDGQKVSSHVTHFNFKSLGHETCYS